MSHVIPPRPKHRGNPNATTHTRIYADTLDDLRQLAVAWNTTQLEAQRYLIDLAKSGLVTPDAQNPAPGQKTPETP